MGRIPEVISAIPTPFTDGGDLDLPALRTNLERISTHVDGVFAAGTTGEFPALTDGERLDVIREALAVFGAERVVAHVGAPSARQAISLLLAVKALGAVRFAAITPYFLHASVAGVADYYRSLRVAAGDSELYAYVFPEVAGTDVAPEDLPALIAAGIDGIKVSGAASTRVAEYLSHAPDGFKLWSGNDSDLPNVLAAGGRGTVSGVSSVCPKPWAAYREAVRSADSAAADAAQALMEAIAPSLGASIAALKFGISLQGLTGGHTRMSIDPITPTNEHGIRSAIQQAGILN
jgi:4-hydroxy-tetrahydrodipicolinate synthase